MLQGSSRHCSGLAYPVRDNEHTLPASEEGCAYLTSHPKERKQCAEPAARSKKLSFEPRLAEFSTLSSPVLQHNHISSIKPRDVMPSPAKATTTERRISNKQCHPIWFCCTGSIAKCSSPCQFNAPRAPSELNAVDASGNPRPSS